MPKRPIKTTTFSPSAEKSPFENKSWELRILQIEPL